MEKEANEAEDFEILLPSQPITVKTTDSDNSLKLRAILEQAKTDEQSIKGLHKKGTQELLQSALQGYRLATSIDKLVNDDSLEQVHHRVIKKLLLLKETQPNCNSWIDILKVVSTTDARLIVVTKPDTVRVVSKNLKTPRNSESSRNFVQRRDPVTNQGPSQIGDAHINIKSESIRRTIVNKLAEPQDLYDLITGDMKSSSDFTSTLWVCYVLTVLLRRSDCHLLYNSHGNLVVSRTTQSEIAHGHAVVTGWTSAEATEYYNSKREAKRLKKN